MLSDSTCKLHTWRPMKCYEAKIEKTIKLAVTRSQTQGSCLKPSVLYHWAMTANPHNTPNGLHRRYAIAHTEWLWVCNFIVPLVQYMPVFPGKAYCWSNGCKLTFTCLLVAASTLCLSWTICCLTDLSSVSASSFSDGRSTGKLPQSVSTRWLYCRRQ